MVTVAVDGNGADLGPDEVAQGASLAAARGVRVLLFADASRISGVAEGVELIDAPVSIAKTTDPAYAVRSTPEASIVQAARAVAEGRAQALVSGGSTGSALAAGLFHLKRDRGIYRPALALPLPRPGVGPLLLLDVGANVICRPEHLVQFAHMGSAFAQAVLGIDSPRVALLSNGEEAAKGTPDLKEVHERLSGSGGAGLRFVGNIEGTHVLGDVADVLVADGFTGNIALKLIEGVSVADAEAAPRRGRALTSCEGWRLPAEALDPGAARGDRPGGHGRRLHARAPPDRHRLPRPLHPPWVCARDRGGGARRRGGRDRHGRARRWRRPVRCATSGRGSQDEGAAKAAEALSPSGQGATVARPMTREQILSVIRTHLADELELDPASIERDHTLPGRPGSRLTRPVHARAGARGQLRREDLR